MNNIKLIFTDLDFTALRNDRSVSSYTAEVFRRCSQYGIATSIATARFYYGAKPFMEKLMTDYAITNDGTMVYRGHDFWFGTSLGQERTSFLLCELQKQDPGIRISVAAQNKVYRNFTQVDYSIAPYSEFDVVKFTPSFKKDAYKIVVEPTKPELLEHIASQAYCKLLHYRGENRYTFLLHNTGKASALRSLADHLNLSMSEIAVFGDDQNDVEMLKACGLGIAVANAIPEVKAVADDFALSNEEDGVAAYIEQHFFTEKVQM